MTAIRDLIERYRRNYGIPDDVPLAEDQVRHHLELERALTAQLLSSGAEDRAAVFEDCYSRLYREIPWVQTASVARRAGDWPSLIGPPPKRVYEVGSGQGGLAVTLAQRGYDVTATEVTMERGADRPEGPGLRWAPTDGVDLRRFEEPATYDAVISNQVLEHLHPDDVPRHFRAAREIVRPGGSYIVNTPLKWLGPADISAVFGFESPVGMHLREYGYRELCAIAREAGFTRISAAFGLPTALRRRFGMHLRPSVAYCRYLLALEAVLSRLPPRHAKRSASALKFPLCARAVFIVAEKP